MRRIRNLRVLGLLILVLILAPSVFAQSAQTGTVEVSATSDPNSQANETTAVIGSDQLDALEPSIKERLLRSWGYQFQLLEQPAFLVATSGSTTATIPNPNKWLQQHSITLTLSEWFPKTANLATMVQTVYDSQYATPSPSDPHPTQIILGNDVCPSHNTLECLAGSYGVRPVLARLFSGATVTFSVAQRDEVQQQVLIPTLSASQGWAWGGEVDFNPASLFITSTNWKNAVTAISGRHFDVDGSRDSEKTCFTQVQTGKLGECVNAFARPTLTPSIPNNRFWTDVAAVAIPTFQLKVLSQFDFIKQGGILVANPHLQRSLKSMSFNWDLKRLIPAASDRIAVGTVYDQALKAKPKPSELNESKLCVLKSKTSTSYVSVGDDSTMNGCRGLAVALGAVDHYAVACANDQNVRIGPPVKSDQPFDESNKPTPNCGW